MIGRKKRRATSGYPGDAAVCFRAKEPREAADLVVKTFLRLTGSFEITG
jgi:hypothetical protein